MNTSKNNHKPTTLKLHITYLFIFISRIWLLCFFCFHSILLNDTCWNRENSNLHVKLYWLPTDLRKCYSDKTLDHNSTSLSFLFLFMFLWVLCICLSLIWIQKYFWNKTNRFFLLLDITLSPLQFKTLTLHLDYLKIFFASSIEKPSCDSNVS